MTISSPLSPNKPGITHTNTRTKEEKTMKSVLFLDKKEHFVSCNPRVWLLMPWQGYYSDPSMCPGPVSQPIRGQYPGHVITLDQSEARDRSPVTLLAQSLITPLLGTQFMGPLPVIETMGIKLQASKEIAWLSYGYDLIKHLELSRSLFT